MTNIPNPPTTTNPSLCVITKAGSTPTSGPFPAVVPGGGANGVPNLGISFVFEPGGYASGGGYHVPPAVGIPAQAAASGMKASSQIIYSDYGIRTIGGAAGFQSPTGAIGNVNADVSGLTTDTVFGTAHQSNHISFMDGWLTNWSSPGPQYPQMTSAHIGDGSWGDDTYNYIKLWANNGYSTKNGWNGWLFMKLNWENNIPYTTPGGYQSDRTYTNGMATSLGTTGYQSATIPAWRNVFKIIAQSAQDNFIPLVRCWNPSSTSGFGTGWAPSLDYPGDDVIDLHLLDLYSNHFYPKDNSEWNGYWSQARNAPIRNFSPGSNAGSTSALFAISTYDWAAHFHDYSDGRASDTDGVTWDGWGFVKASDWALAAGQYKGATNPPPSLGGDGSARKVKPLAIAEAGIFNGPGPFTGSNPGTFNNANGNNDLTFLPYLQSRINWHQNRTDGAGGVQSQFVFVVYWDWACGTGLTPTNMQQFHTVWPTL